MIRKNGPWKKMASQEEVLEAIRKAASGCALGSPQHEAGAVAARRNLGGSEHARRIQGELQPGPERVCMNRPVYGEQLFEPGLRNAPTNENGVIPVFGMLAARLGFHIQAVRTGFPNCDALRQVAGSGWQNVTIEFEFLSGNFAKHGHPPDGCDIIVYWEHNWTDCPPNLEVIALRDVLAQREAAAA